MGIYYYTFLYKGELVKSGEQSRKYAKHESDTVALVGHTLYYTNFVELANIDPIIESHERAQGYVDLKEVLALVEKTPKLKEAWGTIEDTDDIFICQCEWSTISSDDIDLLYLNYNLPCLNCSPNTDEAVAR